MKASVRVYVGLQRLNLLDLVLSDGCKIRWGDEVRTEVSVPWPLSNISILSSMTSSPTAPHLARSYWPNKPWCVGGLCVTGSHTTYDAMWQLRSCVFHEDMSFSHKNIPLSQWNVINRNQTSHTVSCYLLPGHCHCQSVSGTTWQISSGVKYLHTYQLKYCFSSFLGASVLYHLYFWQLLLHYIPKENNVLFTQYLFPDNTITCYIWNA
jgi:hypothetical protein